MKKAIIYSLAVCLISWSVYYGCVAVLGESLTGNNLVMTIVKSAYMLFPMLVAMGIQLVSKEKFSSTGLIHFNFSWAWAFSLLCVIAAIALSVVISVLMPGVHFHFGAEQIISMNGIEGEAAEAVRKQMSSISPAVLLGSTLVNGLVAGCTINALFAFGEEYGWRNYMVHCLRGKKFWVAACLIGFVWGIWHTPLVLEGHNYPQHPVAGVAMMCVFCILCGIIELYFVLKTRSAIIAAVIHGTINALAATVILCVEGGNDLTIGLTGTAGFLALVIICLGLWAYDSFFSKDRIMSSAIPEK